MSLKQEKTENKNEIKLTFTVEPEKFEQAIMDVFKQNAKYFNIPGFRKGKAPFKMVERYYGDNIFYEDAFNELAPKVYDEEIKQNKVEVAGKPQVEIVQMEKGKELIFTAIVATKPEVKLDKYKGISLKKIEYKVEDEDIDHEINHMAEHNSRIVTVEDRPVKDQDIVTIDFEGFVDGKPFEGGKAENHELTVGSKTFIPGFEEQLIGMKIDEEKDIKVKFPDEYFSKDLAGKDAVFHIKLHSIKEKQLPKIDDEFAKDVSEFDTLEELKKSIREKKEKENEERAKRETEEAAVEEECKNTKIDIPSGMIELEIDNMEQNIDQRLRYQGLNLEQYLKMLGKTEASLREEYKEQAEKNVKSRLILDQIVKDEKIEADEKYVKEKIEEMAKQYNKKIEELEKNEDLKAYLEESSKTEQAIKLIVDNAKIAKK